MIRELVKCVQDGKVREMAVEFKDYEDAASSYNLDEFVYISHSLAMASVRLDGNNLRHVDYQTPMICMAAIRQNPFALKYVKEQTPDICALALQLNNRTYKLIRDRSNENISKVGRMLCPV